MLPQNGGRRFTQAYQPIRGFQASRSAHANAEALARMSPAELATGQTVEGLAAEQARLRAEFYARRDPARFCAGRVG